MINGGAASNSSLDAPNIVVFTAPPPSGASIAASFTYAFVCRFLEDSLGFENFMQNLWAANSVKFGACGNEDSFRRADRFPGRRARQLRYANRLRRLLHLHPDGRTTLAYTNADAPIVYAGTQFLANGPLVSGLKYRAATGLNVDRQEITIAARPSDLTSGAQFLVALRDGALDGAMIRRDRVFFSDFIGGTLVDGVTLFYGRVSTVDDVGRTRAKLTVANELVLLDIDMPRNIFAPTCLHTLFDLGCGLPAGAFSTNGTVGAASTTSLVNFSGALAAHLQGKIVFGSAPTPASSRR